MASTHVYDEMKAFLQTAVTPVPVLDWDKLDSALQQREDPFIVLEELFCDEIVASFGDPSGICIRETASIQCHCFVPAPESSSAGRTLAESVQQAFRLQQFQGVRVLDVTPPEPNIGELNDGIWSSVSVITDMTMDRIEAIP